MYIIFDREFNDFIEKNFAALIFTSASSDLLL